MYSLILDRTRHLKGNHLEDRNIDKLCKWDLRNKNKEDRLSGKMMGHSSPILSYVGPQKPKEIGWVKWEDEGTLNSHPLISFLTH